MISLDIEEKVTEGVEDSNRGHRSTHNSQDLPDQFIHRRFMLLIDDVNGFDLSHKHGFLCRLMVESRSRSDRIPVILITVLAVTFNHHWDDLEMVEVVQLLRFGLEILHDLAGVEITL